MNYPAFVLYLESSKKVPVLPPGGYQEGSNNKTNYISHLFPILHADFIGAKLELTGYY
ncbi:MAG: hypothetical protein KDC69_08800 [Flavobacteriaceae bacterium]|nr:hypothetical protein [Flavobacteriaceae bacterium]